MKVEHSREQNIEQSLDRLVAYRARVRGVVNDADFSKSESSLATYADVAMREQLEELQDDFSDIHHVVLIGIGGSNLGTEAIYEALPTDRHLYSLDTIAPHQIAPLVNQLREVPREQLAICVVSKSGNTTETLANVETFISELNVARGESLFDRLICIGNPGNPLLETGAQLGARTFPMQQVIGGRYSVFTAVGLVPLALLGYDINRLLEGVQAATSDEYEPQVAKDAATLYSYLIQGVRSVNFFAFDMRLQKLGFWYRQLAAESLGKQYSRNDEPVLIGFVPTISTPVELHSIGQLYFSGFRGIYTDFVSYTNPATDYTVSHDSELAPLQRGKTHSELLGAMYGGVLGAYNERNLPYRQTHLEGDLTYELGLFMGSRMLEVMYMAELMDVNAFDQPNVELYKNITRDILGN